VVATEGASVRVNPDDLQGRFGVRLTSSRISPEASQKLPTALKPVTGLYAMKTCRVLPSAMTLSLAIPSHLVNAADLRGLDVYGWDGSSWYWLGGMVDAITRKVSTEVVRPPTHFALVQVQDDKPVIGIELPMRDANTGGERVNLPNQLVNEVMPFGVYLGDRGELAGELGGHDWRAAATTPNARNAKSYPVVRNWGSNGVVNRAVLRNLLRSDHAQAAHIKKLLAFVNAGQHAGVAVDYRGLGAAQRDDYVVFLRTLAEALHTAGKRLVVVIAPALDLDQVGQWQNGAYDWRAIAAIADQVHLDLSQEPAVLTSQALDNLMQWAVAHINRRKLQVVVPSLSLRYGAGPAGPFVELVNLDEALRTCALVGDATAPQVPGGTLQFRLKVDGMVDVVYDEATQTYHYSTANAAGAQTTVWLGTSASFRHKLEIIGKYRVRGVTVRGLTSTGNDSGIVPVLEGYAARRLTSSAAPAPLQVSMQWSKAFVTVAQSGAEAQPIVAQVSGAAVQVQLPQEPGEYALTSTVNGINAIATTPQRVKVGAP
jgi:spore germination protein YaaH